MGRKSVKQNKTIYQQVRESCHLTRDAEVSVDSACCAGVTPESHLAALKTMAMCQIDVK